MNGPIDEYEAPEAQRPYPEISQEEKDRWRERIWGGAAAALALIALGMRLNSLGLRPFEEYESFEVFMAKRGAVSILLNHPPFTLFQTVFLHFWGMISSSPFWLRLPYALMGAWTAWLVYLLGRRLYFHGVGLLSSALVAFSFVHLFHSQEVNSHLAAAPAVAFLLLTYHRLSVRPSLANVRRFFWVGAAAVGVHSNALFPYLALHLHFLWSSAADPEWAPGDGRPSRLTAATWLNRAAGALIVAAVLIYGVVGRVQAGQLIYMGDPGFQPYQLLALAAFFAGGNLYFIVAFGALWLKGVASTVLVNRWTGVLIGVLVFSTAGLFGSLFVLREPFLMHQGLFLLPAVFPVIAGGLGRWPVLTRLYRAAVRIPLLWGFPVIFAVALAAAAFLLAAPDLFPQWRLTGEDDKLKLAVGAPMLLCFILAALTPVLFVLRIILEASPELKGGVRQLWVGLCLLGLLAANQAVMAPPTAELARSPYKYHGQQDWEKAVRSLAESARPGDALRYLDERSRLSFFSRLPVLAESGKSITVVTKSEPNKLGGMSNVEIARLMLGKDRGGVTVASAPPAGFSGRLWDVSPALSFLTDPKLLGFYQRGLNPRLSGRETQTAFRSMFGRHLEIVEHSGILVYREKDDRPAVDAPRLLRQFLQLMRARPAAEGKGLGTIDPGMKKMSEEGFRALLALSIEPAIDKLGAGPAFAAEAEKAIEGGKVPVELHLLLSLIYLRTQSVGQAVRHGQRVKEMASGGVAGDIVDNIIGALSVAVEAMTYDPLRDPGNRRLWLLRLCQDYAPWRTPGESYEAIDRAWSENDFKTADALVRDLLKSKPEDSGALWRMADLHLMAGKERAAQAALDKIAGTDRDGYPQTALQLMLDVHRRRFGEAKLAAGALVRLDADAPLGRLAAAALDSGEEKGIVSPEALDALVENRPPDDAAASLHLADALIASGKLARARRLVESAGDASKPTWAVALAKAHVREAENRPPETLRAYQALLELGNVPIDARLDAVNFYLANDMEGRAEPLLDLTLSKAPEHYAGSLYLASLRIRNGRVNDAVEIINRALNVHDADYYAHLLMGQAFMLAQRDLEARGSFNRCLKIEPDNALAKRKLEALAAGGRRRR